MIKIICIGKIKEKFYVDATKEYLKRLSKYTKIEIVEIEDIYDKNINIIKKKEKEKILLNIKDKDYVITLEINGNKLSSLDLSKKIESISLINSNIVFVIGGSYGIDNEVSNRSNFKLSFSDLTFPHQLFRIMLLEQIYRCFKIKNNESYHK